MSYDLEDRIERLEKEVKAHSTILQIVGVIIGALLVKVFFS